MATNQFDRRGSTPPAVYQQQFFVVCGPPPAGSRKTFPRFLRKHWLRSSIITFLGAFLAGKGWAMYDYAGATLLSAWRYELLAGGLSIFTIYLYRTFRRWGQERKRRVMARRKRNKEINILHHTPPPLSPFVQITPEPEFAITIEQWNTQETTRLSEEHLTPTILTDEVIAPDALVLNVEVKKAA